MNTALASDDTSLGAVGFVSPWLTATGAVRLTVYGVLIEADKKSPWIAPLGSTPS